MAVIKQTRLDRIELTPSNIIQLRFLLEDVDNGRVVSSAYHRTSLEPGILLVDQIATVNTHLFVMGWPTIPLRDQNQIALMVTREHTPVVIATFNAARVHL